VSHEFESGFSGNSIKSWHGLATVVPGTLGLKEAWQQAGLDWTVRKVPVYLGDGRQVPDNFAIVRDKDDRILGSVGGEYTPIQNEQLFQLAEALLEQGAQFETAGSLFGGRLVWVLARTDGFVDAVTGDKVDPYIMISSGHNGAHKLRGDLEPVRTICWNTYRQAIAASKRTFAIAHRSGWFEHVAAARRMLGLAKDHFGKLSEDLGFLATRELNLERQALIVDRLIPLPDGSAKKFQFERAVNARADLDACITRPIGVEHGRGTLYQAWNGISEYATHRLQVQRKHGTEEERKERRMIDLSFDTGVRASFAERGWSVLQQIAQ